MITGRLRAIGTHFGIGLPAPDNVRDSLEWLMFARLGVLYVGLSMIVLQQVFAGMASWSGLPLALGYALLALGFGFNLLNALVVDRFPNQWWVVAVHVVFDASIIAGWVLYSSSGGNLYALLYLVQILIVSLIFYQRTALFSAIVSSLLFGLVVVAGPSSFPESLIVWGVFTALFLLLGFVGGFLSQELHDTAKTLREREATIDKLKEFHERLLTVMPTGLLSVDQQMRVNYVNHVGAQILNRSESDVIGKHLEEVEPGLMPFFTQIEMESVEEADLDAFGATTIETEVSATGDAEHRSFFVKANLETGSARLQQTVELGTDEAPRAIRGDVARLEPEAGVGRLLGEEATGGIVLLFQDVTKLVHLEQKLKQHEKLAAVGQLAAGIAHEIRNPLASMSGSIELLRSAPDRKGEERKLMDIAIREIDRLNNLVSEFLDYVKPGKPKKERVDLTKLLSEIALSMRQSKEYKTTIDIRENSEKGVIALGQEEKLKQVVWNLIVNALQALGQTGAIELGCQKVKEGLAKLWVQDDGCGMSEKVLAHLYEPFFTTKDKGTGLGLATVYKIIDAHDGEIRVQSKEGKGTRFEVFLPSA